MPRISKTDRLLAERETSLEAQIAKVNAVVQELGSQLRLVRELRKELAASPKKYRAKTRLGVPIGDGQPTTTVA
jgi:AraC-like DNA-binding protein